MSNTYNVSVRDFIENLKVDADELDVIDGIFCLLHEGEVVAAFPKEAVNGAWEIEPTKDVNVTSWDGQRTKTIKANRELYQA